jgi:hypothetical protein
MASPYSIRYDETFDLDAPPDALWTRLIDIRASARRWRWARDLRIDPHPLTAGSIISFTAVAPIPYRLALEIEIDDVIEGRALRAEVRRDLEGRGAIEIEARGTGTRARLSWDVEMKKGALRIAARTARPLLMLGHNWAVDAAIRSFTRDLRR